ncbi:SMAD/FHA domain-containing protein [Baffinella frigidus]|nr:SMAD/FHA domain-containing protein [Cryptophyta sp. CCMP2293]
MLGRELETPEKRLPVLPSVCPAAPPTQPSTLASRRSRDMDRQLAKVFLPTDAHQHQRAFSMSESSRSLPDGAPLDAPPWATPPTHAGACFVVEPGDGSGRRVVPLSGASYMVGRHEGTGKIVVDHVTVSRKHALVVHEGERTFVVDASSNGTFLNGGPIPKREFVPLSQGDEVRFGDSPQNRAGASSTIKGVQRASSTNEDAGVVPFGLHQTQAAPPEPRQELRAKGSGGAGGTGGGASGAGKGGVGGSGEFLRLCGLRLVVGGKGVVVRTVEVGSAAEGHTFPFSFGDVLSSLDGTSLDGRSASDVAALLEPAASAQEFVLVVRLVMVKAGAKPKEET